MKIEDAVAKIYAARIEVLNQVMTQLLGDRFKAYPELIKQMRFQRFNDRSDERLYFRDKFVGTIKLSASEESMQYVFEPAEKANDRP